MTKTRVRIQASFTPYQWCIFLALHSGCGDLESIRGWLASVGWIESALAGTSIVLALEELRLLGVR